MPRLGSRLSMEASLGGGFRLPPVSLQPYGKEAMKRLSSAHIIAIIALVLALGGSAYAANRYLITSTHQIKPSVLVQLKGNRGPRGISGVAGPTGPQGPAGANGANGANGTNGVAGERGTAGANGTGSIVTKHLESEVGALAQGASAIAEVECPASSTPTGGGGSVVGKLVLIADRPAKLGKGWAIEAIATEAIAAGQGELSVTVFCKTE